MDEPARPTCPYSGAARRSQPPGTSPAPEPAVSRRGAEAEVRSLAAARQVLRAGDVARQAGFGAEMAARSPIQMRPPVLWQDGEEHKRQRTAIAHFFTPMAAKERYRPLMERLADELVSEVAAHGRAELSALAMRMAVGVAAQVVGLTDSRRPGMHARIEAFIANGSARPSWHPRRLLRFLRLQKAIADYFRVDVKPAIDARRREPKDDVISHLVSQGRTDQDVLIEAITYGAAGMVTTREFISMAAWHLLDDEGLRRRYLEGGEQERQGLLAEVIRLEPVVGRLFRRLEGDLDVADGETLAVGTRVAVDVRAANADEAAVGPHPLCLDPDRRVPAKGVQRYGLSFGDGHHRCPGSFLALEEADVFLHRLLSLPGLRLAKPPDVAFNDLVQGYELRDMWVEVAPGR